MMMTCGAGGKEAGPRTDQLMIAEGLRFELGPSHLP